MIDRRLWQRLAALHRYLLLTATNNAASAGLIVAQAILVAGLVAELVNTGRVTPPRLQRDLAILLGIALARAALAWAQDRYANSAANQVIADLRRQVVSQVVALGPRWSGGKPETAIAATSGLDALEPYLIKYLPALLLTALVTPAALLVIGGLDWIALLILLITLPLVPLFMWLIGQMTSGTSQRRLAVVSALGAQVLDLLTGLPTLKAFGREIGPGARVRALGHASRQAAMGTLRVAFLSSMVLELLTTIAVAMVAVSVGLRLVVGGMTLRAGLAVIMLAPEVFAPLRQVAAQFHASTDGLAASEAAFKILDQPLPSGPNPLMAVNRDPAIPGPAATPADDTQVATIELWEASVIAGDRRSIAPANLSARIALSQANDQGRIVALVGPSGSGKSTTALLILGLLMPDAGTVTLITNDETSYSIPEYGAENWWRQITWVPQRGYANMPAAERGYADGQGAPAGHAPAAQRGYADGRNPALSIGQRQRLALQAVNQAGPEKRLLVLDEPTAHLDSVSEAEVLDVLRAWRNSGRTAIVIAHRPALISLADQVIEVQYGATL